MSPQHRKWTFVGGVLNDIHSHGLVIVMQALRRRGHEVANLGTMVPPEDFAAAARETAADALLVANSSGMGETELLKLADICQESGFANLPVYAGGMLTLQVDDWPEMQKRLSWRGICAFSRNTAIEEILNAIEADLEQRHLGHLK